MGEVFLGSTTGIEGAERPVVVKIIRREHAKDPSFIARFLDEARVQAQLQHSGVAQVLEATIDDRTGEPYSVVEYVEGRSLGDVRARSIQVGHAFGWADAVAITLSIADALAHVHERLDPSGKALAIVHRDLSPQNVMVSYGGECKIIDFGTARGQNRRCHTVAGVVFAKPGYVAPEVANGDSGDSRVDIYALGIMLWELVAGRRFLQGDATAHMTAVARNAKNPPPIAAAAGAPAELDTIITTLTAFDRDTRYLSARTAAADLARLLPLSPPLPGGERGVRARVAHLMGALFPGEPGKGRREFARLSAAARAGGPELATPQRISASLQEAGAPQNPPAPPPAKEGDVLGGTRYRLVREIGRGAASIVYEAEHLDLGRRSAIKIIATSADAPEQGARFRREARTLSRLSHEGLVTVHDVGEAADGRLFCVMELLEGETLERLLSREKAVGHREALGVARKVLSALEVAHGAALVHRDIKPANLFLPRSSETGLASPQGRTVKLLDFGLARGGSDPEGATPGAGEKREGVALYGTPEYMAPEQAAGAPVDARADLYALGCVLYEMLTGTLPFPGSSSIAVLDAKVKGSPERPRSRAPAREIPEVVDALVMKALARHPSQRFQTATEMRGAVEAALAEPARRGRSRLVAAATLALISMIGAGGWASHTPRGEKLLASVAWLHRADATTVVAAAPPPQAEPAPAPALAQAQAPAQTAEPAPEAPVADAKTDEEGFDHGDDGDFVDDTPPTPAPEPAVAEKPHRHKHRTKTTKVADAKSSHDGSADDDGSKKARHKHKTKATQAQ